MKLAPIADRIARRYKGDPEDVETILDEVQWATGLEADWTVEDILVDMVRARLRKRAA